MYKTKQMNYNTKQKPIKKEGISGELTVSNNSLRVVTEKYFCLTLLYC